MIIAMQKKEKEEKRGEEGRGEDGRGGPRRLRGEERRKEVERKLKGSYLLRCSRLYYQLHCYSHSSSFHTLLSHSAPSPLDVLDKEIKWEASTQQLQS